MSSEITNHSFQLSVKQQSIYVELGSLVMKFSLPPFQLPTSFNCDKIVVFATLSTLSNQTALGVAAGMTLAKHVLAHPLF
jgi:hypothetical protein